MYNINYNPIEDVEDDGLCIPEVGAWGIEKYRSLGHYADIFTKSMNKKWGSLIYIDLFASGGYSRIKNTNRIIKSGALIALSLPIKFKKYIFCEENLELLQALQTRVSREFPDIDAKFIHGDCNEKIHDIISHIPRFSKFNTVLSFGFIDPFRLNFKFATMQILCTFQIDILLLIATGMAATRNEHNYVNPSNSTIAHFLGDESWRNEYKGVVDLNDQSFTQFLAKKYKANMIKLGYTKAEDFHAVRYKQGGKNVILYHLAFFSKNALGNQFWNTVRTNYTDPQGSLF